MVSESQLKSIAKDIRRMTLLCAGSSGEGHLGGALSISDLLAVLYHNKMRVDPQNPKKPGRDRLIVSKGHAGPAVYAALASGDFFPKDWLKTLNALGTNLPSHCDMNKTPGIDMTTGSLGQGLSAAVGCAIASRLSADGALIYCILGDGESQEGQIWEAAMYGAQQKLDNLIAFTDCNQKQIDGEVCDICSLGDLEAKWKAFGWHTAVIDGHDVAAISKAIDDAKAVRRQPSMILMNTIKGRGVKSIIDMGVDNHHFNVSSAFIENALNELE